MNSKIIIAAVIGGVAAFLLGFLFYNVLLKDMFAGLMGSVKNVMKPDSDIIYWALILGNLIIGYLVAWIFSTWAGIITFAGGAKAGAMMGLLFTIGYDMTSYGVYNMFQLNGVMLDIIVNIVIWTISSGLVGWWLGRSTT